MTDVRSYWINTLKKITWPVLDSLAKGELCKKMPIYTNGKDRQHFTYLEALGRSVAGIAPWLEHEAEDSEEKAVIEEFRRLTILAIKSGVDPSSPDHMNFGFEHGYQPIVDAAFLAHGLIRAPKQLMNAMDSQTRELLIAGFKGLRYGGKPYYSNWLLFSAMIEAALCALGEDWDQMRVDYALRQINAWHVGDGVYSDGIHYHWDYYNSFVIHPMFVDIILTLKPYSTEIEELTDEALRRMTRYAQILEHMIAPDGSFPVTGRSLCYRSGAYQALAHAALLERLPEDVTAGQARTALTAVIKRTMEAPKTFDENGWLTVGLAGNQPSMGEGYISTGSLYLCTTGFLPLGLPESHPFWREEERLWTGARVWSGQDVPADHALE